MSEGLMLPADFEEVIEVCRRVPGAIVDVRRFHWLSHQNVRFAIEKPRIDMALSPRAPGAEGGYEEVAGMADQRYGEMIFLPAGYVLNSRWRPGKQRSVVCEFQLDEISILPEIDFSAYELAASLDVRNPFIRESMLRLARELHGPGFGSELLIESLCRVLAFEVPRHFGLLRRRDDHATGVLGADQLKRVEERALAEGSPPPSVAELAQECGVSPRHFARIFRKTTGMTVASYVTQHRIVLAKAALADRRVNIKQVSYRCGFRSVPAFSAAFRRETGLTPRQFRSAVLENGSPVEGMSA